ncbi:MAG: hypothetical protein H7Z16_02900 [Pyrinomonadaceae bacterium]|nr:hypothetical protein [Pyrinomonadaceae bacterium]
MKQFLLIALLIITPKVICAQKPDILPLGWDLTYKSVLNANHVGPDNWVWKWLGPQYESPIRKLISTWNHEAIESSILLEFPAPHAAEHITMWFVRTKSQAYYIELVEEEDDPPHKTKEALKTPEYDRFFGVTSRWQQATPVKPENTPENAIPGYSGFLSFYDRSNSRQMLLVSEDFVICDTKKCDSFKPGRLAQALTILSRFKV